MLVSIILNNYNYGAYLSQAIDSALNQTYDNTEIIIVDDGSTDNSREIISGYGDKIKAIFKENGGQVSTVNVGWEASKGDIIIFLDSDDVLFNETVEKCVEAFKSGDYINVYYMLERVDKNLKPIGGVTPEYGDRKNNVMDDIKLWGFYICPPTSGHAFRREFLKEVMPAPETIKEYGYEIAPDAYLSSLAGINGKILFIQEILGSYRIHNNNKSSLRSSFSKEKLRRYFMVSYIREQYQKKYAKTNGIILDEDRSANNPTIFKYRLLAYRLYPKGHPIPEDTRFNLLKRGLKGVFIFPYLSFKKRCIIFIGVLILYIMPKFVIKIFVEMILSTNKKML